MDELKYEILAKLVVVGVSLLLVQRRTRAKVISTFNSCVHFLAFCAVVTGAVFWVLPALAPMQLTMIAENCLSYLPLSIPKSWAWPNACFMIATFTLPILVLSDVAARLSVAKPEKQN